MQVTSNYQTIVKDSVEVRAQETKLKNDFDSIKLFHFKYWHFFRNLDKIYFTMKLIGIMLTILALAMTQ